METNVELLLSMQKVKNDWKVFINGGRINTNIDAIKMGKKSRGFRRRRDTITHLVDRDGTKAGFDLGLN